MEVFHFDKTKLLRVCEVQLTDHRCFHEELAEYFLF